MRTGFLWGNVRDRDHSKDFDVQGNTILKWISKRLIGRACTVLIWLRLETGGGLL